MNRIAERGCSGCRQDRGKDWPHKPGMGGRFGAGLFLLHLHAPVRGWVWVQCPAGCPEAQVSAKGAAKTPHPSTT